MEHYTIHVSDHYGQDFGISKTIFTTVDKACDHLDKFFKKYNSIINPVDREEAKKALKDDSVYEWETNELWLVCRIYKYDTIF